MFLSFDGDRKETVDCYAREKYPARLLELYKMAIAEGYGYYAEAIFMGGIIYTFNKEANDEFVSTPVSRILDNIKKIVAEAKANYESMKELEEELAKV